MCAHERRKDEVKKSQQVLLGILGGGVPPVSSPNPDPISDQNMSFSAHVFGPGL